LKKNYFYPSKKPLSSSKYVMKGNTKLLINFKKNSKPSIMTVRLLEKVI
jgi:hypothetical protein